MTIDSGRRRVTAADIARSLGISRATVGFVLNDTPGQTISEGTRSRVLSEAARLGYRPHTAAQALASGKSRLILWVLPDWPIDYSLRRNIDEASLALEQAGYSLVTYTRHEASPTRPLWESLNPDVVVGLLPFSDSDITSMRASGIRDIVPEPDGAQPWSEGASIVIGPSLQVQHLAERGHTLMGFAEPADPRIQALSQARLAAANLEAEALGFPALRAAPFALDDSHSDAALSEWLAEGVTAVVAYNDDIAAIVVRTAHRAGIRVPQDLAVIGHDDSPIARVFIPSLTTIHMDDKGLGRLLAGLALNKADGRPVPEGNPAYTATVVEREST